MKLTLRTVAGGHFERCVELSSTVGSLKSTLVEDYDAQTLGVCYNGSLLDDDHKTLAECGMADDCWAVVVGVPLKPSRRTLKTAPLPSQLKLPDLPPAPAEATAAAAGTSVPYVVPSVDATQRNVRAPEQPDEQDQNIFDLFGDDTPPDNVIRNAPASHSEDAPEDLYGNDPPSHNSQSAPPPPPPPPSSTQSGQDRRCDREACSAWWRDLECCRC